MGCSLFACKAFEWFSKYLRHSSGMRHAVIFMAAFCLWTGSPAAPAYANYQGGPVISGPTHVYFIWYGNWTNNTAPSILNTFVNVLAGTTYYNTVATYTQSGSSNASNSIRLSGSTSAGYNWGGAISNGNMQSMITNIINKGIFPLDTNAIYVVLTSADVVVYGPSGAQLCAAANGEAAFHNHFPLNGVQIKYALVMNRTTQACKGPITTFHFPSPNGNPAADDMASLLAHELAEAVTDPLINLSNGWIYAGGEEMADLCAAGSLRQYANLNGYTYFLQPLAPAAASGTPPCVMSTSAFWAPVYRYYNQYAGQHFMTLNYKDPRAVYWWMEGVGFYVLSANNIPGTHPIYNCNYIGGDFVSNSSNCEGQGYIGLLGYLYSSPVAGTFPVYRFVKGTDHLITTSWSEGANAGYTYEFTLGWTY